MLPTKQQTRTLKSHYGTRWTTLRHNHKNSDQVLLMEDRFIINNCLPGPVLAVDCLGEVYRNFLDIDTQPTREYNTVLMLNNIEFKYLTLSNLVDCINTRAGTAKRLILNLNLMFLIYDRVNYSIDSVIRYIVQHLNNYSLVKQLYNLNFNYGFGQIFIVLDRND